ncbi:MAG: DUF4097 family beta strand repeat protein [Clostridia bacterium]|nr:DUF4097 family beta strand repeat protein [Clostridia bacterium]
MSRKTKIWLITAASFILLGCIIFGGAMTVLKWDFTKLSTVKYETNRYEIDESYKNISIVTDTADVVFMPSEGLMTSVVCYEFKNAKHSVEVKDDTLVVRVADTRKWYEHIGIYFGSPKVTVYIPQGEYGELLIKGDTGSVEIPEFLKFKSIDVSESTGSVTNYASASEDIKIKTSTGAVCVENVSANSLDLCVSTGKVTVFSVTCGDVKVNVSTGKTEFTDIKCKNVVSGGSTGDILLKNVIAAQTLSVVRSTGDVKLEGCDAADMSLKTSTGSVKGSLLSDKVFITQTDTGSIDVPKTATGGKCEINTDTGDIKISVLD